MALQQLKVSDLSEILEMMIEEGSGDKGIVILGSDNLEYIPATGVYESPTNVVIVKL